MRDSDADVDDRISLSAGVVLVRAHSGYNVDRLEIL